MPIPRRELLKVMGAGLLALGSWPKALVQMQETVMEQPAIDAPFSEALLRIAGDRPENTVVSPESIVGALRLLLAGAHDETAANIRQVLGPSALAGLGRAPIPAPPTVTKGEPGSPRVRLANGIWVQSGIVIAETFRRTAVERFNSEVGEVDFARAPREAGKVINDWVCRATEKHITTICPPDGPGSAHPTSHNQRNLVPGGLDVSVPGAENQGTRVSYPVGAKVVRTLHESIRQLPVR